MASETSEVVRAALPLVALLIGIAGIVAAAILLISTEEKPPMSPTQTPSETEISLPPIDLNAPTEQKTATFAMG